ncbi:MAG: hypothetical protein H6619_01460 [Deltaproteobacteria bacterium]|nr:hypothetical protein [Deltaproteobacteria bacterium]
MRYGILLLLLSFGIIGCSDGPEPLQLDVIDTSYQQRGEYLVKSVAACGFCHGQAARPDSPLVGGRTQTDFYGQAVAPNLTSAKTGLAEWDMREVVRAVRGSHRKDEEFSVWFHRGFEWMSDIDVLSVAAYIKSLPAQENQVERRSIGFIEKNTTGLFRESARDVPGYVPPVEKDGVQYGKYLVDHVARCVRCHNSEGGLMTTEKYLGGGQELKFNGKVKVAPEITNSPSYGIGSWSERDVAYYLRTGITPDKREVDSSFCPIAFYQLATDEDLNAIASYLKSLPVS